MNEQGPLRGQLAGGDRRSVGDSDAVAEIIASEPDKFAEAIALMGDDDPVIRMRASDAVEKASRSRPGLLSPFVGKLLGSLSDCEQQEVRWHILMMLPRLPLMSAANKLRAWSIAQQSLLHPSRIVQCEAVSAMHALSRLDPNRRSSYASAIKRLKRRASPSVQARIRRLHKPDGDE